MEPGAMELPGCYYHSSLDFQTTMLMDSIVPCDITNYMQPVKPHHIFKEHTNITEGDLRNMVRLCLFQDHKTTCHVHVT